jgi:hypothetical protein
MAETTAQPGNAKEEEGPGRTGRRRFWDWLRPAPIWPSEPGSGGGISSDRLLNNLLICWLFAPHWSGWIPAAAVLAALCLCTYLSWQADNLRAVAFFSLIFVLVLGARLHYSRRVD